METHMPSMRALNFLLAKNTKKVEFCNKIMTHLGFENKAVKTKKSKSFQIGCHKSTAILKTQRSSSQN